MLKKSKLKKAAQGEPNQLQGLIALLRNFASTAEGFPYGNVASYGHAGFQQHQHQLGGPPPAWQQYNPFYWCFEVGHLARSHNLPWNAEISEKWQNNKNSWHLVKALSDSGKNPSQIAAPLKIELSFPKHMGKMEKLCAIGAEYAKIMLEAAHANGSEVKVTKKEEEEEEIAR